MTQKGSPTKGDVYNWHQITDVVVGKIAASANIANGDFVFQDGANGFKIVPTSSQPNAQRVRFCPIGFNNSGGVLGARNIETIKKGAKVVARCDGTINVGEIVKPSTTTAGRVIAIADQATPTAATNEAILYGRLGIYLGHVGEIEGVDNDPTNAADGDLVVIQLD